VNRHELHQGLVRLAAITAALVAGALLCSALFLVVGARGRGAISAGTGTVGMLLVFGGVAAFAKASPVRHARATPYASDVHTEQRRETERLALGLFAYGIAFSAVALVVG
jgi:hypothetical protein